MKQLLARAIDLLYPRTCANCGRVGEAWCAHCHDKLKTYPFEHVERELDGGLRVIAADVHSGLVRDAIHAFKFEGATYLADTLGAALDDALIKAGIEADVLVPVPLHTRRETWRGYNQAALLADAVAVNVGVSVAHALTRLRHTGTQVGRDARERRNAVRGAFAADSALVAGTRVLLIDDVVTTGSTLAACAEALSVAGAANVIAACVASA